MTDEELVERLRDLGDHAHSEPSMHHTAAEAIQRLREQLGQVRVCVNCGKYVPASHERWKELPECVDPESGLSACTFNSTPAEAIEHFRQCAEKVKSEKDLLESCALVLQEVADKAKAERDAAIARADWIKRENAALYEWKDRAAQMDREKTTRIVELSDERWERTRERDEALKDKNDMMLRLRCANKRAEKTERERDEARAEAHTNAVLMAEETGKLIETIARADRIERERDALAEAIKPFLYLKSPDPNEAGDPLEGLPDGHGFLVVWDMDSEGGACQFTAGQIRRARAAIRAMRDDTP
jgi:hypothetical protein